MSGLGFEAAGHDRQHGDAANTSSAYTFPYPSMHQVRSNRRHQARIRDFAEMESRLDHKLEAFCRGWEAKFNKCSKEVEDLRGIVDDLNKKVCGKPNTAGPPEDVESLHALLLKTDAKVNQICEDLNDATKVKEVIHPDRVVICENKCVQLDQKLTDLESVLLKTLVPLHDQQNDVRKGMTDMIANLACLTTKFDQLERDHSAEGIGTASMRLDRLDEGFERLRRTEQHRQEQVNLLIDELRARHNDISFVEAVERTKQLNANAKKKSKR